MKKTLTVLFASIAILFTACTKDSELPIVTDSSWYLNGVAHFAVSSSRTEASGSTAAKIIFTDTNKDRDATMTVFFKALPKTAGTYTLVSGNGIGLGESQLAVLATDPKLGSDFIYTDLTGTTVQVSITNNGKIKIEIPEVTLNSSTSGSYKFKANVFEIN